MTPPTPPDRTDVSRWLRDQQEAKHRADLEEAKRHLAEAGRDGLARTSIPTSALDDPDTPLGEVGPDDPVTVWRDDSPTRASIHDEMTRDESPTQFQDARSPSHSNPEARTNLGGHAFDALRARVKLVEDESVDSHSVLVEVRETKRYAQATLGVVVAGVLIFGLGSLVVCVSAFIRWGL